MDSATLFVKEALIYEGLRERLLVCAMHDCLITGKNWLYSPLLLCAVNDTEDLTASATDFAPDVWLDPLLDSGNGIAAVVFESAFASADSDCSEFPH